MDNKLGELLEHPVRLLIQNLHNSNIYSIFAHINLYKNIIWKKNYLILSVENLEWCTKAYNNCYGDKAVKIGLKLRESNPNKRQVNQIDDNGNIINTYQSIREAARQLGNIKKDSNIISGIQTHQKRYGYYWEYASV